MIEPNYIVKKNVMWVLSSDKTKIEIIREIYFPFSYWLQIFLGKAPLLVLQVQTSRAGELPLMDNNGDELCFANLTSW